MGLGRCGSELGRTLGLPGRREFGQGLGGWPCRPCLTGSLCLCGMAGEAEVTTSQLTPTPTYPDPLSLLLSSSPVEGKSADPCTMFL